MQCTHASIACLTTNTTFINIDIFCYFQVYTWWLLVVKLIMSEKVSSGCGLLLLNYQNNRNKCRLNLLAKGKTKQPLLLLRLVNEVLLIIHRSKTTFHYYVEIQNKRKSLRGVYRHVAKVFWWVCEAEHIRSWICCKGKQISSYNISHPHS